ncbi:MAG: alpha/beta hydrolase [Cyclobacteriaceae bacterium]|nr:alpha/beta hydrolase [Cyclobacteriaceae bacterium]MDX5466062.1 alpha/beta hydrolase [Cyclobacteriaceae bacterium]
MKDDSKDPIPMLVLGPKLFYEQVFSASLKKNFAFSYCNHRGFSENPHSIPSAYGTLQEIVVEIEEFIQQNSLKDFLIFGHSGHAYMALEYAKSFPEKVRGLILCACSPDLSPNTHQKAEVYFQHQAEEIRKDCFAKDMSELGAKIQQDPLGRFKHFVLSQKAKNWYDLNFDPSFLWEGVPTHLPTLDFVWGKLFAAYQLKTGLEKVVCPVLMLQGKYDFAVGPFSLWNDFLPHFSNLHVKILSESGHYPMLEQPEEFDEELLTWKKIGF